jgi:hypothetical protein
MNKLVVFCVVATACAGPEDYFAIGGVYTPAEVKPSQCCNTNASAAPCSKKACSSASGPVVGDRAINVIPGNILPADVLLGVADANNADWVLSFLHSHPNETYTDDYQRMEWYPRTADSKTKTLYVHKTRCALGLPGTTVSTSKTVYKKCTNSSADVMGPLGTFQLPPYLCQQTCDKSKTCTGYTIDDAGENCWTHTIQQDVSTLAFSYDTYWKVGKNGS